MKSSKAYVHVGDRDMIEYAKKKIARTHGDSVISLQVGRVAMQ